MELVLDVSFTKMFPYFFFMNDYVVQKPCKVIQFHVTRVSLHLTYFKMHVKTYEVT